MQPFNEQNQEYSRKTQPIVNKPQYLMKTKPFRNTPLDERKEKNNTRVRVYL